MGRIEELEAKIPDLQAMGVSLEDYQLGNVDTEFSPEELFEYTLLARAQWPKDREARKWLEAANEQQRAKIAELEAQIERMKKCAN